MNKKWLLGATLGLSLLGPIVPSAAHAEQAGLNYKDLNSASDWALDSIRYLNELGLTKGYDNQSYQPHKAITRQEVAALLARALNLPQTPSSQAGPSDMSSNTWSYGSIQSVLSLGLMGDPGQPFRPLEPVTREELVSIFARATGAEASGETGLSDMDSEAVDPANREQIETSVQLGLLKGDGDTLNLKEPTERQEVAVVMTRLLKALAAPANAETELTVVGPDKVRIGAFEYPMTEELKSLLGPANAALLEGTTIKVRLGDGYRVQELVDMTIPASKTDLVLDGGQLHLSGNLKILGDKLTIKNLQVDGTVSVEGESKESLLFENVGVDKLSLGTAAKVKMSGKSSANSVVVPDEAVEGTQIVLENESAIEDIVVPDKRLVSALVQDYGANRGKVRLINGKPPETDAGTTVVSAPTMLYAIPSTTIEPVAEAYALPAQVSVRMSDGSSVLKDVVWQAAEGTTIEDGEVVFGAPAIYTFTGAVQGLSESAELNVDARMPIVLSRDSADEPIEAVAGQAAAYSFAAAPDTAVNDSVSDVAYRLQWFDADGDNQTSEVEITVAGGLEATKVGDSWLIRYPDEHAVSAQETIAVHATFLQEGTYTLQAEAVKYNPQ